MGSIPDEGTKIPQASRCDWKKNKPRWVTVSSSAKWGWCYSVVLKIKHATVLEALGTVPGTQEVWYMFMLFLLLLCCYSFFPYPSLPCVFMPPWFPLKERGMENQPWHALMAVAEPLVDSDKLITAEVWDLALWPGSDSLHGVDLRSGPDALGCACGLGWGARISLHPSGGICHLLPWSCWCLSFLEGQRGWGSWSRHGLWW